MKDNPFTPEPQKPIMGKVETVERYVDYHRPLKQCQRVEWQVYPTPPRVTLTIGDQVYSMPDEVLQQLLYAHLEYVMKTEGAGPGLIAKVE